MKGTPVRGMTTGCGHPSSLAALGADEGEPTAEMSEMHDARTSFRGAAPVQLRLTAWSKSTPRLR